MSFVLEFELPSLIELAHLLSDVMRGGFVSQVFAHQLLQVVGHESKRLGDRSSRSLSDELIPKLVLNARLLSEYGVRFYIENTVVTLV